jgi:hypothetical protein
VKESSAVHRSFQLQILTWLAGLAVVGALARPSLDTTLFAAAFVLGTALLRVRESWRWAELVQKGRAFSPRVRDPRWLGDALGAAIAWSAAVTRARVPHVAWLPDRLDTATLALAAVFPTVTLLLRVVNAMRRRARLRRLD